MKKLVKYVVSVLLLMAVSILTCFSALADTINDEKERSSSGITYLHQRYPDGSYYSENNQECDCHNDVPHDLDICNCGKYYYYDSSYDAYLPCYQCVAFAKYCYNIYNDGIDVPYHANISSNDVQLNSSNLYTNLRQIGSQAYVRGYTQKGTEHSLFIVSYTSSTVTVMESNYPSNCIVNNETFTYTEFLKHIKTLSWYCKSDGTVVD